MRIQDDRKRITSDIKEFGIFFGLRARLLRGRKDAPRAFIKFYPGEHQGPSYINDVTCLPATF